MEVATDAFLIRKEPGAHEGDFKLLKLIVDFPFRSARVGWGGDREGLFP